MLSARASAASVRRWESLDSTLAVVQDILIATSASEAQMRRALDAVTGHDREAFQAGATIAAEQQAEGRAA